MSDAILEKFLPILCILVALVMGGVGLESASCRARWQGSEFQSRYGVFAVCRISRDGVRWIPEQNYRELS